MANIDIAASTCKATVAVAWPGTACTFTCVAGYQPSSAVNCVLAGGAGYWVGADNNNNNAMPTCVAALVITPPPTTDADCDKAEYVEKGTCEDNDEQMQHSD